jgi:uncharacterized protein (DUF302 family)
MPDILSFQVELSESVEEVVDKVTSALQEEGFGVLTIIDVKATLKEKIDVDFRPYVILGACNPPLAYQALENEPQVGLLLPCNVTVEETKDGTLVSFVNPEVLLGINQLSENSKVKEVARDARLRLERVAASLGK